MNALPDIQTKFVPNKLVVNSCAQEKITDLGHRIGRANIKPGNITYSSIFEVDHQLLMKYFVYRTGFLILIRGA